ncbi:MAG: LemA family protein [Peptococcaceae bacterium]|nr:LemA family protein [Peptococcaceae bacterium]
MFIIGGSVILLLLIIIAGWWISTSNNFIRMGNKLKESASGIEVSLVKRHDLLTKMLDATKGYMAHERETFAEIVSLRRGMSIPEMNQANDQMNRMEARIKLLAENYPQLRSSDVFCQLQHSIHDCEEHLQAARRLYNSNATSFNNAIQVFPNSIVSGMKKMVPAAFFAAETGKLQDVRMSF